MAAFALDRPSSGRRRGRRGIAIRVRDARHFASPSMTMKAFPRITTERLVLRAFEMADAPAVERLAGAWEVASTTLSIPHPYPPGAAAMWIATHAAAWDSGENLTLAIGRAVQPDDLVGAVGLALTREHFRAELGYWIGVDRWGCGYATEASRALLAFGFRSLGLHRIQARHFLRNAASGRVMQKIGMRFEGVHRAAYWRWGAFEDVAMYAVLAPEWEQQNG